MNMNSEKLFPDARSQRQEMVAGCAGRPTLATWRHHGLNISVSCTPSCAIYVESRTQY